MINKCRIKEGSILKKRPEQTAQTKQTLIDAFWQLCQKKGLGNVTVSAITKTAGFNRTTFYEYFTDMDELLTLAEDEILESVSGSAKELIAMGPPVELDAFSEVMIRIINEYGDRIYLLLGEKGDPGFIVRLKKKYTELFYFSLDSSAKSPYTDYVIAYTVSAMIGLMIYWHENGKQLPPEELIGVIHKIASEGLLGWTGIRLRQE